jgi:hypothetical protein
MPRVTTWLVVGAIAVLGAAAALDALRGGDERTAPPPPVATEPVDTETDPVEQLRLVAVRLLSERLLEGALLVSDENCTVRGLSIPGLEELSVPDESTCRFAMSPDGRIGADGEYLGPGTLVARCRDRTIGVRRAGKPVGDRTIGVRRAGKPVIQILGTCPPAWTPDGRLTVVSQGELREVDLACPAGESCTRPLLTQGDLRAGLGRIPWEMTRPEITAAAWLSPTRVAVVVRDLDQELDAIAVFEGRKLLGAPPFLYEFLTDVRASPHGSYAAALLNRSALVVVDKTGEYHPLALRDATGLAWSPDERWVAAATGDEVFVMPVDEGATGPVLIPIRGADVVWVGRE